MSVTEEVHRRLTAVVERKKTTFERLVDAMRGVVVRRSHGGGGIFYVEDLQQYLRFHPQKGCVELVISTGLVFRSSGVFQGLTSLEEVEAFLVQMK